MTHTESIEIAAPLADVFDAVRRLERMGEWSPENHGGEWVSGDGSSAGDQFLGTNRIGEREWQAPAVVTRSEPGVAFEFTVPSTDNPMADWRYGFKQTEAGTRVTESWEVFRLPESWDGDEDPARIASRTQAVQEGMRTTLAALKATLEA